MSIGELSPQQLSQAREIARILDEGSLGLLVGAGLSRSIGLPTWDVLLDRMAFVRFVSESDLGVAAPSYPIFRDSLRAAFPDGVQQAQVLAKRAGSAFDRELWYAMYLPQSAFDGFDADTFRVHQHETPDYQPTELMRMVLALACRGMERPDVTISTFNFDDLLERASLGLYPARSHMESPSKVIHQDGLTVAHLHGRLAASLPPRAEDVVLASADYHKSRAAWRWPYRRLFDLFEQRTVLMIGIGLADPDLLQVLDLVPPGRHFLLHAVDPSMPPGSVDYEAWRLKQRHWEGKVDFISLSDWSDQAAFIHAVRVFAAGGDGLWVDGHRRLLEMTQRESWEKLWEPQIRGKASRLLRNVAEIARDKLGMAAGSQVEAGLFVPNGRKDEIDLPFRSDVEKAVARGTFRPGYRRLRATTDAPQGVAGMAYARAELLIAQRDADLFDNRFDSAMTATWATSRADCAVVACAPVFDWAGAGVPVGVGYITSSDPADLAPARLAPGDLRFLDEVILGTAMVEVLRSVRRERSA